MKFFLSAVLGFFLTLNVMGQSLLQYGMTVVANLPIDTATDYCLHVYDTRNVIVTAPLGVNWSMNTMLPVSSSNRNDWKFGRMGTVFGVTIDDLGNIYLAAGDVYEGAFIAGTAGSGGIYKVNANNWSVSDFITTVNAPTSTSTTQIPNTGVGLGNITFDKFNHQLFATNFEDGKIYRLSMTGTILSKFDPGIPDSATSGAVPCGDRIWAVGVNKSTSGLVSVYYSYWNEDVSNSASSPNLICSVPLDASGDFAGSEHLEITVPNLDTASFSDPVSSINFSSDGKMLAAERSMQDIGIADAHASNCFEFVNTAGTWNVSHTYCIGNFRWIYGSANCAGGADFAYADSDPSDSLNGCEQLIWATGDALRFPGYNPNGGVDYCYGLTGIPETGNDTVSTSSTFVGTTSYFIDLNNDITDVPKTYMGSCAVFRNCLDTTTIVTPPVVVVDTCDKIVCDMINVMTPNGDGTNDKFKIDCIQGDGWQLEIFDRWGTKVYADKNYQNDWDGGKLIEGVYYYILTSPCKDKKKATGFFHLIR